jgi:chromosome partitioning protein
MCLGMGRKVDAGNLVGASEIARRLGVTRPQAVHNWRHRYDDFPEPVAELDMGIVWNWPDVERWARKTGRL